MAKCAICKRDYAVAAPIMAPSCPTCGFNSGRPESLDTVAAKIGQIGATKMATEPVAGDVIRQVGNDALAQGRVKRTLKVMVSLHSGADWIGNVVEEAPVPKRLTRIAALDTALRYKGLDPDGQEVFGSLNHGVLASNRQRLVDHCTQGWNVVKTKWTTLSDPEKRHFISEVFEHDKGYPQSVQSAVNYVRPVENTLEAVLLKILYSSGNTNPYTSGPSATAELGDRIKAGWATAKDDEKDLMWFTLLTRIGNELNTHDRDQILSKLTQNRRDVVDQLSTFVPRQAAEAFVDRRGGEAWDKFM